MSSRAVVAVDGVDLFAAALVLIDLGRGPITCSSKRALGKPFQLSLGREDKRAIVTVDEVDFRLFLGLFLQLGRLGLYLEPRLPQLRPQRRHLRQGRPCFLAQLLVFPAHPVDQAVPDLDLARGPVLDVGHVPVARRGQRLPLRLDVREPPAPGGVVVRDGGVGRARLAQLAAQAVGDDVAGPDGGLQRRPLQRRVGPELGVRGAEDRQVARVVGRLPADLVDVAPLGGQLVAERLDGRLGVVALGGQGLLERVVGGLQARDLPLQAVPLAAQTVVLQKPIADLEAQVEDLAVQLGDALLVGGRADVIGHLELELLLVRLVGVVSHKSADRGPIIIIIIIVIIVVVVVVVVALRDPEAALGVVDLAPPLEEDAVLPAGDDHGDAHLLPALDGAVGLELQVPELARPRRDRRVRSGPDDVDALPGEVGEEAAQDVVLVQVLPLVEGGLPRVGGGLARVLGGLPVVEGGLPLEEDDLALVDGGLALGFLEPPGRDWG
ncbi:hypothetical protein PG999_000035 [Apiospora kogelbergensis]|uniref:Uncharacterized protein n=1 Tax=Apiospora kogelbergensis TaxID=1337665 RepID=A0AAW0RAB3_9PEZI